jgi:Tol biopolymer transport system component
MSPNGHRIAFWGLRPGGGVRDIWTIPAAGGEAVAVTDDEHTDWNPIWSPDGRHLYFCSNRSGSMNVWRVPIDEATGELSGAFQPVTTGVSSSSFMTMAGNGKSLAYLSGQPSINLQRIPFDAERAEVTGEPEWITRGARILTWSNLSADREWIAFTQWSGQEDIFIVRSDGSGLRQLTDDAAKDRGPVWSPDGSEIASYSDRSGSYEIWAVRPDGSSPRRLTETPGRMAEIPVWSPDGSRLVLSLYDPEYREQGVIINPRLSFSEQTYEKLPPHPDEGSGFEASSWSPDGRWIAGTLRKEEFGGHGVVVYSLETKTYTSLTDVGMGPRWLPDSHRLLYRHRQEIHMVDRQSWESRKIYSILPDEIATLWVSRDGRELQIGRRVDNSDLWLMTME